MKVRYENLTEEMLDVKLFCDFVRRQTVTKCLRKVHGEWRIVEDPFVDDWSDVELMYLVECLKRTLLTGGCVYGAFTDGKLKAFMSVEANLFGGAGEYAELSCLHVSEELRGKGIGRILFEEAKRRAKAYGARKLYISAHSAVETQAFYRAMECTEAVEYSSYHVQKEPCDCQMECFII